MEIITERLILREPRIDDFKRYWSMLIDPVAKKYTGGVTQSDYDSRLQIFKQEISQTFFESAAEFSVIRREDNLYIGYCGFRYSDELNGNEFLYGYCQDAWGHGYGYEAALNNLKYLFSEFRSVEYIATSDPDNTASIRILTKLGFKKISKINNEDREIELFKLVRKDFEILTEGV